MNAPRVATSLPGNAPTTVAADAKPAKAPKPAKVPVEKDQKNGVTRPKAGSLTGRVWEIADAISNAQKSPAERSHVIEEGEKAGLNASTVTTQYGKWCKYYGIKWTKPQTEQPPKASKAAKAATEAASATEEDITVE